MENILNGMNVCIHQGCRQLHDIYRTNPGIILSYPRLLALVSLTTIADMLYTKAWIWKFMWIYLYGLYPLYIKVGMDINPYMDKIPPYQPHT